LTFASTYQDRVMNRHDGYEISTDPAKLDIAAMHAYLSRSYWSPGVPLRTVAAAAKNSLCFGLYDAQGKQVGLARVVTDYATFAYLCDVYVLEEHRGKGLGKWLVETVCAHPALTGARRIMLGTRDAHELYRRHGFAAPPDDGVLMQILRPDMYRRGSGAAEERRP
jgi:GNAT superfamily N-acetyltransferase